MGVELVAVLPNPLSNDFENLRGLEWQIEEMCPSIHLFAGPFLRRTVYWHETLTEAAKMRAEGRSGPDIGHFIRERQGSTPDFDSNLSAGERKDLERRSWRWEKSAFASETGEVKMWSLNTRFLFYIEFLPKLCFLQFLEKIDLQDADFRERHLKLTREMCRLLQVDEFLVVFDSAADSSAINGDFQEHDFAFQRNWLRENIGPPKSSLQEMEVELEECDELSGYYWESVTPRKI